MHVTGLLHVCGANCIDCFRPKENKIDDCTASGGESNEAWTSTAVVSRTDLPDCGSGDHSEHDPSGKVLVVFARLRTDRYRRLSDALLNVYLCAAQHMLD